MGISIRAQRGGDLGERDVTDEGAYYDRRELLKGAGAGLALYGASLLGCDAVGGAEKEGDRGAPDGVSDTPFATSEKQTSYEDATSYNNFYEFGTDKSDPKRYGGTLVTDPWAVEVSGEVAKPGKVGMEDLLRGHAVQERIYRMRCVEAWSMVIPWLGIPLGEILKRFEPTAAAKYVAFRTLHDPQQMPGQRRATLEWPYREGLRLDEAMHPLTILATGMYGRSLPNQNGAPLRLVVPWKYGFKGIKSIVGIHLQSTQPPTSWNMQAPREYGFYANVNPSVDHPRWSQKKERRIGELFRRATLPFNGYGEQVASLYSGMDLRKLY